MDFLGPLMEDTCFFFCFLFFVFLILFRVRKVLNEKEKQYVELFFAYDRMTDGRKALKIHM